MIAQLIARLASLSNLRHSVEQQLDRFDTFCEHNPFKVLVTASLAIIMALLLLIIWQLAEISTQTALANRRADHLRYTIEQTTPARERVNDILRYYPRESRN